MAISHACLLVACALILLSTLSTSGAHDQTDHDRLAKAVYLSTIDLYDKIIESNVDQNVFFSPASIYVALAMLYAGAGGETKAQLASALHLDNVKLDGIEFYKRIQKLMMSLSSSKKDYTLKMANRLFSQKEFSFKDEYLNITDEYFRAKLEALDFRNDPSGSRSKINRWVATMTSNKIKELFQENTIKSDTLLVLANAVYFNSSWHYKFDKRETKSQTFYLPKNQTIEVPMMNLNDPQTLGYHSSEIFACQILELPYIGKQVSMLIFLPNEVDGLPLLRERLRNNSIADIFHSFQSELVKPSLPKFKLEQNLDLKKTLQSLGLKDLFGNADLSGISDSGALRLSEAIHKAYISVDEGGSEAAGATGLEITKLSLITYVKPPINFVVDRPFAFGLVEKATGTVLFFGAITNPLKSN